MPGRSRNLRQHDPRRRWWVVATALGVIVMLAGCSSVDRLQFRQDDRLHIEAPRNLSTLHLPFTVRWRMSGFTPAATGAPRADAGKFAVFVDRYPMRPGKGLHSIVDSVDTCRGTDQCLDPDYLAQQFGVYVTTQTSVTVHQLPNSGVGSADADSHFVTIVLLDTHGQRIGESVWYVSFQVTS